MHAILSDALWQLPGGHQPVLASQMTVWQLFSTSNLHIQTHKPLPMSHSGRDPKTQRPGEALLLAEFHLPINRKKDKARHSPWREIPGGDLSGPGLSP